MCVCTCAFLCLCLQIWTDVGKVWPHLLVYVSLNLDAFFVPGHPKSFNLVLHEGQTKTNLANLSFAIKPRSSPSNVLPQSLPSKQSACMGTGTKFYTSQARSSHRFEGSNEPPFVRQVSFFSCSLYERAPCLVITRRLCSSNAEIWSNGTVNVCTKAVRWASPRPRRRCDQRRRVHFSSSSIAQRAVCHSCKVLQSTMRGIRHGQTSQALFFRF